MKKYIVILLALLSSLAQAQDRLLPTSSVSTDEYQQDLDKNLLIGSTPIFMRMPSNMQESALNWDNESSQFISVVARGIIWNFRYYSRKQYEEMDHDSKEYQDYLKYGQPKDPKLEIHRLTAPKEVGQLVKEVMHDAIQTAMPNLFDDGFIRLDGTHYLLYDGEQRAKFRNHMGTRCQELRSVLQTLYKAVEAEDSSAMMNLVPRMKALRTSFRQLYPEDIYDYVRNEVNHSNAKHGYCTAYLHVFRITMQWCDSTELSGDILKDVHNEEAAIKAKAQREKYIKKYGKPLQDLARHLFLETRALESMTTPITLIVHEDKQLHPIMWSRDGRARILLHSSMADPKKLRPLCEQLENLVFHNYHIWDGKQWVVQKQGNGDNDRARQMVTPYLHF